MMQCLARVGMFVWGLIAILAPHLVLAATGSITPVYPSSEVPVGVRVAFIVTGTGFSERPTYRVVDAFPGGVTTVNIDAGGNFSWVPNKDDIGTHAITITLTDSEGATADVSQTIVVTAGATITASDIEPADAVSLGTPITATLSTSGLFSPTFSLSDSAGSSSIGSGRVSAAGIFTWTPIGQDVGSHDIKITGQDSFGSLASTTLHVEVLGPPAISVKSLAPGTSVHAGTALTFLIDASGFVKPSYVVVGAPEHASSSLALDGAAAAWTPEASDVGSYTLYVAARDDAGRAATTTLRVTVLAPLSVDPIAATSATPVDEPLPAPAPVESPRQPAPTSSANKPKTVPAKATAPRALEATTTPSATTTAAEGARLAYPTPEPPPPAQLVSTTTFDLSSVPPPPSFGAFVWESIVSFFGSIAGIFGR